MIVLLIFFQSDLYLRLQIGSVLVHLAIHSQSSEVRRIAIQTIEAAVASLQHLVSLMLREALTASLIKEKSAPVKTAVLREEAEKPAVDMQRRYATLLLCCGNKEAAAGEKDDQLVDLIVLAHHSTICELSCYIDCRKDPTKY